MFCMVYFPFGLSSTVLKFRFVGFAWLFHSVLGCPGFRRSTFSRSWQSGTVWIHIAGASGRLRIVSFSTQEGPVAYADADGVDDVDPLFDGGGQVFFGAPGETEHQCEVVGIHAIQGNGKEMAGAGKAHFSAYSAGWLSLPGVEEYRKVPPVWRTIHLLSVSAPICRWISAGSHQAHVPVGFRLQTGNTGCLRKRADHHVLVIFPQFFSPLRISGHRTLAVPLSCMLRLHFPVLYPVTSSMRMMNEAKSPGWAVLLFDPDQKPFQVIIVLKRGVRLI